jgi:hypothetical protein
LRGRPYGRQDLLLLDELGYVQADPRGGELLFQVITEREERASIGIGTNLPFPEWGAVFPDQRLVASIVDRVTFNAHILETRHPVLPAVHHQDRHRALPQAGLIAAMLIACDLTGVRYRTSFTASPDNGPYSNHPLAAHRSFRGPLWQTESMSAVAILISAISVAVAALSVAIAYAVYRRGAAQIDVEVTGDRLSSSLSIKMTNKGMGRIQVSSWSIVGNYRCSASIFIIMSHDSSGPRLPFTLDGYHSVSWILGEEFLKGFLEKARADKLFVTLGSGKKITKDLPHWFSD